jgi:hypothetical protein
MSTKKQETEVIGKVVADEFPKTMYLLVDDHVEEENGKLLPLYSIETKTEDIGCDRDGFNIFAVYRLVKIKVKRNSTVVLDAEVEK